MKWFKENWRVLIFGAVISSFVTTILTAIGSLLNTLVNNETFWNNLLKIISLKLSIPIWIIVLLIFTLLLFQFYKRKRSNKVIPGNNLESQSKEQKVVSKPINLPKYSAYKTDDFKNLSYSWRYDFENRNGKINIVNLKVHCPKCDTPFLPTKSWFGVVYNCPRCDYRLGQLEVYGAKRVRALIVDNINRQIY
jgi:hypothetical protein